VVLAGQQCSTVSASEASLQGNWSHISAVQSHVYSGRQQRQYAYDRQVASDERRRRTTKRRDTLDVNEL